MPRILKEPEVRRNEILDAAQRLVFTKGYERMTIQDILDELQMSKGAFYHYFDSKGAVLEALIERMVVGEVVPLLDAIVQDERLSALEKLHRYFDHAARWKLGQKALMLELLKIWLADENAIVRQKLFSMTVKHTAPPLTEIVRQGMREGVFTTQFPDQVCHVLIYILYGLSDTLIDLLAPMEAMHDDAQIEYRVTTYIAALTDAMERVLGAPSGALKLIEPDVLEAWFIPETESNLVPGKPPAGGRRVLESF